MFSSSTTKSFWEKYILGGSGGMVPQEFFVVAKIGFKLIIFMHSDSIKRDFYGLSIHGQKITTNAFPPNSNHKYTSDDLINQWAKITI